MGCSQAIIPELWGLSCQIHANTQKKKKQNKQKSSVSQLLVEMENEINDVGLYLTLYALPNMESRNDRIMLTPIINHFSEQFSSHYKRKQMLAFLSVIHSTSAKSLHELVQGDSQGRITSWVSQSPPRIRISGRNREVLYKGQFLAMSCTSP